MPPSSVEPYRLTLLGPWDLRGPEDERVSSVLAQPRRLCLLAYLALAPGPVSRSAVVAVFWPESDEERARNALSQALFHLRRSLTTGVVESIDGHTRLAVTPDRLECDARSFLQSGTDAPDDETVELARRVEEGADFFEGWNADDCQPLQEWLDGVRRRVREHAAAVTESAAAHEVPAEPPSLPGVASAPPARRTSRRYRFAAGVVLAAAVVLIAGVAWSGREQADVPAPRSDAPTGRTDPVEGSVIGDRPVVAVLMPSVTAADSSIPRLADAVQGEILAALDGMDGIRPIPFSSADAGGLERFISEQFQPPDPATQAGVAPDWVIIVSLRIAGGRIRAMTQFRDGAESHRDWYPEGHDYEADTPGDALIEIPQEIARDVARRFEGWIARERSTPRQPS